MTEVAGRVTAVGLKEPAGARIPCLLDGVSTFLIGEPAAWFRIDRDGDAVVCRPQPPTPRRCTIRLAAMFQNDCGLLELNTVMGRLVFPRGATEPQLYRPFTRDPQRNLRELYFPVETMPHDDWPTSPERWSNFQALARRLLAAVDVPWNGLAQRDVDELVEFIPWPEPIEGCLLHALTQWSHKRSECVIEIGSLRGRSLSMLAMALRGVGSDSLLVSIDPHAQHGHNATHARLALRQISEEDRLVQIKRTSSDASRLFARGAASLVFVDGDHSYDQVVADFENNRDILAPGGCLVFHDYGYGNHNGLPDTDPGVRAAVNDRVMSDERFRPLLHASTLLAFVKEAV